MVGQSLGKALADLASRIEQWHGAEGVASTEFLDYCQEQGYLNFSEHPDYAAAGLYLAEQARITDIWHEAFAHCVGMKHHLDNSPESTALSATTRDLIEAESLEMEMHIVRTTKALGEFLEEDLGPEYLGLSKPLRDHLDRFKSTLHAFYVNQVGYFPPDPNGVWDKRLWCGMYNDFRSLYTYLADTRSSTDIASIRGLNGGICAVQNIQAFDDRHGFFPLPHPLPLLPNPALVGDSIDMQRGLRNLRRSRLVSSHLDLTATQALSQASNSTRNPEVASNRLVREYVRFERLKLEERVSVIEARKVRWILICGVLQMLISITRAPSQVQDTHSPSYPMCVLASGSPPWLRSNMDAGPERGELVDELYIDTDVVKKNLEEDRISIHPDCEADCADDFFARNGGLPRSASDMSLSMMPSPLRRNGTQLSRTASIRSSVRSAVGSLSRRNSVRRGSLIHPQPRKRSSFCEIVIEGYGNGLKDSEEVPSPISPSTEIPGQREEPGEDWNGADNAPTLELHQLTTLCLYQEAELDSPSTTRFSDFSGRCSESSKSSYSEDDGSPVEECSNRSDADLDFSAFKFDFTSPKYEDIPEEDSESAAEPPPTYQARRWNAFNKAKPTSVNAGCYTPTGAMGARSQQRAPQSRALSSESVCSVGSSNSSVYPEANTQAAEIEEEETRGRRRLRGLDRLPHFGFVRGEISLPETPDEDDM